MASETAEEAESEFATIRRDGGNIPSKEPVSFVDWIVDFYEIDEPKHLKKQLNKTCNELLNWKTDLVVRKELLISIDISENVKMQFHHFCHC